MIKLFIFSLLNQKFKKYKIIIINDNFDSPLWSE